MTLNPAKEIEIYGAEIKVYMENGVFEFSITDEDPSYVWKVFRQFMAEHMRSTSSKIDPL